MTSRFWRMEARPLRILGLLFAIPTALIFSLMAFGALTQAMGFDFRPGYSKLRVGMTPETVRELLGDPDCVATSEERSMSREDWWYNRGRAMQLTFIAGKLDNNHEKDRIRD